MASPLLATNQGQQTMSTKAVISAILILSGLTFSLPGNTDEADSSPVAIIEVSSAQAYVSEQQDALILDVRTPAEYDLSHIPDALNLNVQDESFAETASKLDRDKTYIVHCTKNPADGRSSRALATLLELGFKNLYSLEGGYVAWKDANLPLIGTDE
jgi:rhodanese-related sulfurtransferase